MARIILIYTGNICMLRVCRSIPSDAVRTLSTTYYWIGSLGGLLRVADAAVDYFSGLTAGFFLLPKCQTRHKLIPVHNNVYKKYINISRTQKKNARCGRLMKATLRNITK